MYATSALYAAVIILVAADVLTQELMRRTPEGKIDIPVALVLGLSSAVGFVLESIDTHDNGCRHITRESDRRVISVAYRLAP